MKNVCSRIFCIASSLLLCACAQTEISSTSDFVMPHDTDLEFWITQRVSLEEMETKGCTYLPGWMGADEYLDSRYEVFHNGSMAIAPDIHVTYLVTGYPDTLDDPAITRIEITDPSIKVYGLSMHSTEDEIRNKMNGIADAFVNDIEDEGRFTFTVRDCSFVFASESIMISVSVTNHSGVQY